MKAWTDEECSEHAEKYEWRPAKMIRAAVEEARREEREACAMLCADLTPSAHWDARDMRVADMIKAAILARDKEPRDAER